LAEAAVVVGGAVAGGGGGGGTDEATVVGAAVVGGAVVVGATVFGGTTVVVVGLTLFAKTSVWTVVGGVDTGPTVVGLVVTTTELTVKVEPGPVGTVVTLIDEAVPEDRFAVNFPIPNAAATQPIAPRAIGHRRTVRASTGGAVTCNGAVKSSRGVMTEVEGGPGGGRGGGATLMGGGGIALPSPFDGGCQDIRSRSPSLN
jgi:hypothetical protein